MQQRKTGRKSIFTKEEQQFIIGNYLNMRYRDIAEYLGFSEPQVRGWINHNCKKKNRSFDTSVFRRIDTAEKAYWLGYIYADGWISKYKTSQPDGSKRYTYEMGMELCRNDRAVLEEFNRFIGGNHAIYDNRKTLVIANNMFESTVETSVIRIYSKQIVSDLNMRGIDFNKTYSDRFPVVTEELFPHFLRGYIDGDGCIYEQKRGKLLCVHITACRRACLEYIHDTLLSRYGIRTSIYSETDRKYRLVCFSSKSVQKLLDMIYDSADAPRLARKYLKYKSYYGLAA